jgi:hypothetical protein
MFVMNVFEQLSFTFASRKGPDRVKQLPKQSLFAVYREMRELESAQNCTLQDILADKDNIKRFKREPDAIARAFVKSYIEISDKLFLKHGVSRYDLLK